MLKWLQTSCKQHRKIPSFMSSLLSFCSQSFQPGNNVSFCRNELWPTSVRGSPDSMQWRGVAVAWRWRGSGVAMEWQWRGSKTPWNVSIIQIATVIFRTSPRDVIFTADFSRQGSDRLPARKVLLKFLPRRVAPLYVDLYTFISSEL